MAERKYRWQLPYRPVAFAAEASLVFELRLELPDELVQAWRARNRPGSDYLTNQQAYVVDSVLSAREVFEPLVQSLHDLYAARVADPALVTQGDVLEYLLAFVQQFPYATDQDSKSFEEYGRYPIETLADGTGDCECLAMLYAALVYATAVSSVGLIEAPSHVAVAVADDLRDGSLSLPQALQAADRQWYWCEATGAGWRVGQIPPDQAGQNCKVAPLA